METKTLSSKIEAASPLQEFVIAKSYDGYPSRNQPRYKSITGWDNAVVYLDGIASSWKRNGGLIVSRSESELIVEEADGSMTITFEIKEA